MLPRLDSPTPLTDETAFADALRRRGFAGDIALDHGSRTVMSTDNSIYQRFPRVVLYPRHTDDVIAIAELARDARFRQLAFCPRGGGTSTNGQSLGDGVVVDLSKHMNRILEINTREGWARVEAGVVKDQLNAAVKTAGLFFAPDLSTSNRATIGGMINTDASGQGSCRYGKTRDHVLALRSVLPGGDVWESSPLDRDQMASVCDRQDRWGQIHRVVNDIAREHGELIARTYPILNRSLTGYDLAHVRTADGRFDLNSILCGSEGSLAFVVEATVRLLPLPKAAAVIAIEYNDFIGALRDSHFLAKLQPTAVETVDARIVELARGDTIWVSVQHAFSGDERLAAVNLVELSGASIDELEQHLAALEQALEKSRGENPSRLSHTVLRNATDQQKIWAMRKKAVGLLGNMAGTARPVPFVEDTAVPPENLADFITEFRRLLDRRNLVYGMFGHADAGVIHVRPALDMRDPAALRVVREISDEVQQLVMRFGGVLWGEHGKGLRSEYSPQTFGDLYPQLQRIKREFDPDDQMNPGKVASPGPQRELLRLDAVTTRGARDRVIASETWNAFPAAMYCNGNGTCFNWDPRAAMCPSWKATRERQFSPKGRAALFKEWLTLLQPHNVNPVQAPTTSWFERIKATAKKRFGEADFSHEVYRSMDECLACKACATQCPVQVDVPSFRSVFLQHYFSRYLRPLRHLLVANLERMVPLIARAPWLYNALTQTAVARPLGNVIGLTAMPRLRGGAERKALKDLSVPLADAGTLARLNEAEKARGVILVQDVFTAYFETEVVREICRLLQTLGFRPYLAPFAANGKPLHVLGFLTQFHRIATATSTRLRQLADCGMPLVGMEPSMTLVYRSEYRQAVGDAAPTVMQLSEWLASRADTLRQRKHLFNAGAFRLLPHCTEASVNAQSLKDWQCVFASLGQELTIAQVGCCGMAGTYGHELHHQASSRALYEMSWAPELQRDGGAYHTVTLCATGFSCRAQVARFAGKQLTHPLQALLAQLKPESAEVVETNAAQAKDRVN